MKDIAQKFQTIYRLLWAVDGLESWFVGVTGGEYFPLSAFHILTRPLTVDGARMICPTIGVFGNVCIGTAAPHVNDALNAGQTDLALSLSSEQSYYAVVSCRDGRCRRCASRSSERVFCPTCRLGLCPSCFGDREERVCSACKTDIAIARKVLKRHPFGSDLIYPIIVWRHAQKTVSIRMANYHGVMNIRDPRARATTVKTNSDNHVYPPNDTHIPTKEGDDPGLSDDDLAFLSASSMGTGAMTMRTMRDWNGFMNDRASFLWSLIEQGE